MTTNLAKIRTARGLSQRQLSALSGIHQVVIARIESGSKSFNRLHVATALALADALEVDVHELVDPE